MLEKSIGDGSFCTYPVKFLLQHLLLAIAGRQRNLALILHNPFDAFITRGRELHSSPASPSDSTSKHTLLNKWTMLLNQQGISVVGGKKSLIVILGQPFCMLAAWDTQKSARKTVWSEMLPRIPTLTLRALQRVFCFVLFQVSKLSSRGLEPGSFMFKAGFVQMAQSIVLTSKDISGDVYHLPSELSCYLPYS